MTVVIGFTAENFSILATDTRLFVNGRKEDGILDNYNKLYDLPYPLGWCCGAGFNHILENFVQEISANSLGIFFKDINSFTKNLFDVTAEAHSEFIESIEKSSIFSTWFYENGDTNKLHSIAYMLKQSNSIGIQKNTYFIDWPYDYTDEMVATFVNKYDLRGDHNDNLDFALSKILHMFNEISSNSDGVSRICDIGIQIDTSKELMKHRIKNNIENLLLSV
ncbi:hypothetical protein [Brevibacillus formosus]|uniref:hypothetical protein n=1 Tax=Brevibacillus formosus TaxID=54913 RepID=UPI003F1D0097